MSDKPITLELPEELLARATSAQIDLRGVLIEGLVHKLQTAPPEPVPKREPFIHPPEFVEEMKAYLRDAEDRVAAGQVSGRVIGLHPGEGWMSDDFDDPLPDEFWGDLFT